MIQLEVGNVLLKPSHRRQLTTWLRRAVKLGERLGDFALRISLRRAGRCVEVRAKVHDAAGDFTLRARKGDMREALRQITAELCQRLHDQYTRTRQLRAA
jgi:hypothetical protein